MNWLTKCFWTSSTSTKEKATLDANTFFSNFADNGNFCGDNLLVAGRNLGFLSDQHFMQSFRSVIDESNYVGNGIIWRIYTFCWCARAAQRIDGDYVECGVSYAANSRVMVNYLGFATQPRSLFLYDVWDCEDKNIDTTAYSFNQKTYDTVKAFFAAYPNVKLVKGFVPDTLHVDSPKTIAFLHIDMNNPDSEISALEVLFERVSSGGLILLDDFGASGYYSQHLAETSWFSERGYSILELPTGQGLVIK